MTKQYEEYYGPEKDTKLFRTDIFKAPNHVPSWISDRKILEHLKYLDEKWSSPTLPLMRHFFVSLQNHPNSNLGAILDGAHRCARQHLSYVSSASAGSGANQNAINNLQQLNDLIASLRHIEHYSVLAENRDILKNSADTLELLGAFHACAQEIKTIADTATKKFDDAATKSLARIEEIASNVKTIEEKARQDAEEARANYAATAITAFGNAFGEEAKEASLKANSALSNCVNTFLCGSAAFVLILLLEFLNRRYIWGSTVPDTYSIIKWSSLKFIIVAVATTMFSHFLRENRNFSHVALANRHRKNLCSAYLNVSKSMEKEEKLEYLKSVMPVLSSLGKTGFIMKEETHELLPQKTMQLVMENVFKKT